MFTSLHGKVARTAALAFAVLLSACGGGHHDGGHPGHPGYPAPPGPPSGPGPTYDFVQIGFPWMVTGQVERRGIANGGLVAGTARDGESRVRAFYFNGSETIDLGTLGGTSARAYSINPCGHITGFALLPGGLEHAFLYDGAMHDLGTLDGGGSEGYAISACGKVAGWSAAGAGQVHAFVHDGSAMRDLGTFGGNTSYALAINKNGQATGYAYGPGNAWYHAFLYDLRTGAPKQDLGSLGVSSFGREINDAGQVTGYWLGSAGQLRAFIHDGTMRDLGTLGGSYADARAINNAGQVIGVSSLASGRESGFFYEGGAMTGIGTLPGGLDSEAVAINASGLVVGSSGAASGSSRAISWTRDGGIVDLNGRVHGAPHGIVADAALAVADDGNIVVRTTGGTGLALLRKRPDDAK